MTNNLDGGSFCPANIGSRDFYFFPFVFLKKCGQQPGGTGFQPIKETKEIVENHTLGPAQ